MKTILVTGANGYLGNVLYPMLIREGHDPWPVDLNLFLPTIDITQPYSYDICTMDWDSWFELHHPAAIVHLASISNDPACELDPCITHEINTLATIKLVQAAVKYRVPKFVFASSASVYGEMNDLVDENAPTNPLSAYAKSKLDAEAILLEFASKTFQPVILRFGTLFGPSRRMRFDLAINLMVKDAITTGAIKVFGGSQWRPFLHVVDAARAIVRTLDYPGGDIIFNIVRENLNIYNLATRVQQALLPITKVVINPTETEDARNYALSGDRMVDVLKFGTVRSVNHGIVQIAGWVLDAQDQGIDLDDDRFYTTRMWKARFDRLAKLEKEMSRYAHG